MRYSASDKIEIIRLVEQSHGPARRALEKLGIPRSSFYRSVWIGIKAGQARTGKPWRDRPSRPDSGLGTASQRQSAARLSTWRSDQPEGSARGNWRCASPGRGKILCLGGVGLSASESARSYHPVQGLHRHQSGRGSSGTKTTAPNQLWQDRLHLSQDHGMGLVLPLHRAGRLLALHCRLEALCDDESAGRHGHPRSGAGGPPGSIT